MPSPVLFVNIGWMKRYEGPAADDPLIARNFGYFKHDAQTRKPVVGHEQWNIRDHGGSVYGYVPREPRINLRRLGAPAGADRVEGVLVVFVARDHSQNKLKVVGWYRNATVFDRPSRPIRYPETSVAPMIRAQADQCHVLPVSDRTLEVPTAKKLPGGVGQSPVWYAEGHPDVVGRVWDLVRGREARKKRRGGPLNGSPRNPDPELRLRVERAAMDEAMRYFDDTVDVSRLKLGWDIEAASDDGRILIEVKGLSGDEVGFELTPREYEQMLKHRERYLLLVMNAALSVRPKVRIFRCERGAEGPEWVSEQGERLKLEERTGARCRV